MSASRAGADDRTGNAADSDSLGAALLSPLQQEQPVEVLFNFELFDINNIDSVAETFEFTGFVTLTWRDPRLAFDASQAGVREKFFQGDFQFNELAIGWYPQLVLMNESGPYTRSGVQLRVKPDGSLRLTEKITAVAEVDLNMRSFPVDSHRLKAVFALLGHSSDEVVLRLEPEAGEGFTHEIRINGWTLNDVKLSIREQPKFRTDAGVLSLSVAREASYLRRLITLPMLVIVLLSFSIFWMDKSSLADRNSISFIGVLTGVAFQHIVVNVIPPVSYITLMHGFLFISFFTMAATVPVNFVVAAMDKKGVTISEIGSIVPAAGCSP